MTVYHEDDLVTLHHGDCVDVMRAMPDNSVDAIVTDPPYGINFMGKAWDGAAIAAAAVTGVDHTKTRDRSASMHAGTYDLSLRGNVAFQVWSREWAVEAYRVLKPGGHLLAFGGTRTWHRLACAIEDAGFEVRDSIAWMYGSGFPKSMNVAIAIDKAAGAMGHRGRRFENSGLRSQGIDVPNPTGMSRHEPITDAARKWQGWGTALKPAFEPIVVARRPLQGTVAENVLKWGTGALNIDASRIATDDRFGGGAKATSGFVDGYEGGDGWQPGSSLGRWPANVILDESQAAELDKQSGVTTSPTQVTRGLNLNPSSYGKRTEREIADCYGDTGGASRFFYTPKASTEERPRVDGIAHPTVKPVDLMRYLVKLVTPPGGTVLEPFAGSGTTLEACIVEGFRCIGIEREADYLPLIVARLSKPIEPVMF